MTGVRRLAFLLVVGLGGLAVLLSLGAWQLRRLTWKLDAIAALEARMQAPALALDGAETAEAHDWRSAEAVGRFVALDAAGSAQARFLTSEKPDGPGWRLIAAFELENGRRVLIDRGFVPDAVSPRTAEAPRPIAGPTRVEGVLRWPDEASFFTPDANAAERVVFARDVGTLAAMLEAAPVLLVARTPTGEGDWPRPSPATVALPNNHLGYAITWFALAAVWAAMTAALAWRGRRSAAGPARGETDAL